MIMLTITMTVITKISGNDGTDKGDDASDGGNDHYGDAVEDDNDDYGDG